MAVEREGSAYGPTQRDLRTIATLPEIISCISSLQSREGELSAELADTLSDRAAITDSLSSLQSLLPHLDNLCLEAECFHATASATAKTADHVGGHVRLLDEEMRRVREAAERVGQVMELKSALAALQSSMIEKDWEAATRHCARAMSLPAEVISGQFAETAVPTPESHLPPAQTLQAIRDELLAIFRREFEKASQSRDAAATSRFFKLFPSIGWEVEGLEAYAAFVVDLVRVRAPASARTSSPLYYITALTALFESIAVIVDQHQPIVEKYYGPGKMTRVLERLLREADQVVQDLIEGWEEERAVKRKVGDAASSQPHGRKQTMHISDEDEEALAPREVDGLLTEMVGMSGRWSLFRKFMYDRLKDDEGDAEGAEDFQTHDATDYPPKSEPPADGSIPSQDELQALDSSDSHELFKDILMTYYIPLEVWYTRVIIDKAHRSSNTDAFQSPAITTTPDDVFYMLKLVISRVLSCGFATAVKKATEQLRDIVDRDYIVVIKKKLDDVYRTGSAGGVRAEKAERENRKSFIILLNDLDVSATYMERLMQELAASSHIHQFFLENETESVRKSVLSFNSTVSKLKSALRAGIEQLFNQLMRPKLRTFIQDVYKDVSYILEEDNYTASDQRETVRKRFVKAWETLVDGYKDVFTDSNYRLFFGLALDVLVRPWERLVVTFRYNELGAIRFDQDLRSIMSFLSSQTVFGDVREKFVRLQQISTLLNLDSDEDVEEFYNGSGIAWQLNDQEARAIAALRV